MSSVRTSTTSVGGTYSGTKLLFNAELLKDLLSGKPNNVENKRKKEKVGTNAERKRKKARQANNELFRTILKQETGSIAPSTFKKGKGKTRHLGKKWISLPFHFHEENYKQIKMVRKSANNVFEFASTFGIGRDDAAYLDRHLLLVTSKLSAIAANLRKAVNDIVESSADLRTMTIHEASLIIDYLGLELTESQLTQVCQHAREAISVDTKRESESGDYVMVPADVAMADTMNNCHEPSPQGELSQEPIVSSNNLEVVTSPFIETNPLPVVSMDISGSFNESNSAALSSELFVVGVLAICRQQLLASCLAERRGIMSLQRMNRYGDLPVPTSTRSADLSVSMSMSTNAAGDLSGTLGRDPLAGNQAVGSTLLRSKSAEIRSKLHDSSLESAENKELSGFPFSQSVASMSTLGIGSIAEENSGIFSSTMPNPTLPSPSAALYQASELEQPSLASKTMNSKTVSGVGSASSALSTLPPLRLKMLQQQNDRKKLLARVGYDGSFARPTPRCLIGSGFSQKPSQKNADVVGSLENTIKNFESVAATVAALRAELSIANAGLQQLDSEVDSGIMWVAKNCADVVQARNGGMSTGSISTMLYSDRSKNRCRQIAAGNMATTYSVHIQTVLQWSVSRWKRALTFNELETIARRYARVKAIEMITEVHYDAMARQYLRGWKLWLHKVQAQIWLERNAAVIEIQKIVRGKLGKLKFHRRKMFVSVTRIQCVVRKYVARRRVQGYREAALRKRRFWAARRVFMFFDMVVKIHRAKKRLLQLKEERAATKLQKVHRGGAGRKRYAAVKHRKQKELEKLRLQREQEEATRRRLLEEKEAALRKEKEEMEEILRRRQLAEIEDEKQRQAALKDQTPQRKNLMAQLFGNSSKTGTAAPPPSTTAVNATTTTASSSIVAGIGVAAGGTTDVGGAVDEKDLEKKTTGKSVKGFFGFGATSSREQTPVSVSKPVTPTGDNISPSMVVDNEIVDNSSAAAVNQLNEDQSSDQFGDSSTNLASKPSSPGVRDGARSVKAVTPKPGSSQVSRMSSAPVSSSHQGNASSRPGSSSSRLASSRCAASPGPEGSPTTSPPRSAAQPPSTYPTPPQSAAGFSRLPSKQSSRPGTTLGNNEIAPVDEQEAQGYDDDGQLVDMEPVSDDPGYLQEASQEQIAIPGEIGPSLDNQDPGSAVGSRANSPDKSSRPGSTSQRVLNWFKPASASTKTDLSLANAGVDGVNPASSSIDQADAALPSARTLTSSPSRMAMNAMMQSAKMLIPPAGVPATEHLANVMTNMFSKLGGSLAANSSPDKESTAAAAISTKTSPVKPKKVRDTPLGPEEAVWMIQNCARKRQARKKASIIRKQKMNQQKAAGNVIRWAVISMQRIIRGRLGRKRMIAVRVAVQKSREKKKEKSAIKIQAAVRGMLARIKYKKIKKPKGKKGKKGKAAKKRKTDGADADDEFDNNEEGNDEPLLSAAQLADFNEKLKRMEEMERNMTAKEIRLLETAKKADEQAAAIAKTLQLLEEKSKAEAAEFAVRQQLMMMAAGEITDRSEYRTNGSNMRSNSHIMRTGGSRPASSRYPSVPPTPRTKADGPIASNVPKMEYDGDMWYQLWDIEQNMAYWYCEETGKSQWAAPGEDEDNVSVGAMTDYSTDRYSSGAEYSDSEYEGGGGEWQEYWDEQAQAKYWYNNNTGEASWTKPTNSGSNSSASRSNSRLNSAQNTGSLATGNQDDWVCYVDDATGQEYWYNSQTGETSWA